MSGELETLDHLVFAISRGDRNAFASFYRATSSKLYGIVARIVRSKADADEILQEVYLKIWSNASSYSPERGSAMSWAIAIARHRSLDFIRSAHNGAMRKTLGVEAADHLTGDDVEMSIVARNTINRYLRALDEETRAMVLLAYCYGFSREELSDRFKMPANTIKTRLRRGLSTLREHLEQETIHDPDKIAALPQRNTKSHS